MPLSCVSTGKTFLLCFRQPHSLKGTDMASFYASLLRFIWFLLLQISRFTFVFNFSVERRMCNTLAWRSSVVYRMFIFLSQFLGTWDSLKSPYLVFQTVACSMAFLNYPLPYTERLRHWQNLKQEKYLL